LSIIRTENLTYTYSQGTPFEKTAISNVSIQIEKGTFAGVIGHTGSGKSTLIQHFNGLLKPTTGHVFIFGNNIHTDKKNLKNIRRRVGLVFQYPEHQLFESTVYKDVAFGPLRMGLTQQQADVQVRSALDIVGLGKDTYDKSPFELSGGQKRRAAIAGVLAMEPEILILDEPAAGLDPRGREEILTQIKKMHTSLGITVILVSHNMDDAARLSERVLVMSQGRLVCDGTPAFVFSQEDMLKGIGLDTPEISRLMSRLHNLNPRIPLGVFSVQAAAEALLAIGGKGV
jgi:energy-coupling factor transport system ATP-binding protein